MEECLKVGPWGGKGWNQRSFKANKGGITEIVIFHGGAINSISLKCGDQDGVLHNSNKIYGNGGHRNDKVHFAIALIKLTQLQSCIFLKLIFLFNCILLCVDIAWLA